MKLSRLLPLSFAFVAGAALAVTAGTSAPDFAVADSNGKTVKLSDYKGKFVVLEWTNPECPFVRAQYGAETMQALQKEAGAKDIVWLSINSTNQSSSEYKTGAQMSQWMKEKNAAQKAILIDSTSAAGRAYDAKTTPHMPRRAAPSTLIALSSMKSTRSALAPSASSTCSKYSASGLSLPTRCDGKL